MKIVTGYKGTPHITAQQDRYINQAAFGTGSFILPIGDNLAATISGATSVTIASGGVSIQGCVALVETAETLQIEAGTPGMNRMDYICAEYTREANGVENVSLVVKTGTPTTGTPSAPAISTGKIDKGETPLDYILYQVNLVGVQIDSITQRGVSFSPLPILLKTVSEALTDIMTKTNHFEFASGQDMWNQMSSFATGQVFTFRGAGQWSQDIIAAGNTVSWGIGIKGTSTAVAILCVSADKLHYWTVRTDGTAEGYTPLNLKRNA